MLTPAFELSQDEKFVHVYIKTPYIKIQNVEYSIDGHCFKFYAKPYFLRLNFPAKIIENGYECSNYNADKGLFTVHLPKLVEGEDFPDLDLVTKLLAPKGKSHVPHAGIEVVSETCYNYNEDKDEEDFHWEIPQEFYDEKKELQELGMSLCTYGFANKKTGVFIRLKDELKDVTDNPNPDELSFSERRIARIAVEDEKFNEDHYLADLFDNEEIDKILCYEASKEVSFTEIEKQKLQQLPNREYHLKNPRFVEDNLYEQIIKFKRSDAVQYLLDHREKATVFYSLVDIMFAFAYNRRTTLGDNTVESAWTISKLSSTLCWFEKFTSLNDVLLACARRSLSYPLYRHWELSCKVLKDVRNIFTLGRRKILKCLLEILMLFNDSEPRYLLNELYITDYCIWIQQEKDKRIESLAKKLSEATIAKNSIGWELKELETAARLVLEEENRLSESESCSCECSTEDDNDKTDSSDNESEEIRGNIPYCS